MGMVFFAYLTLINNNSKAIIIMINIIISACLLLVNDIQLSK